VEQIGEHVQRCMTEDMKIRDSLGSKLTYYSIDAFAGEQVKSGENM